MELPAADASISFADVLTEIEEKILFVYLLSY